MLGRRRTQGDTLIEVLFAVTIFSLVVVGSLTIMNQGVAAAQRSLEITLVRQQIDAQAEALRLMHESYLARYQDGVTYSTSDTTPAAEWYHLTHGAEMVSTASAFGSSSGTCPAVPNTAFIVDVKNVRVYDDGVVEPTTTYAKLIYDEASPTVFSASEGLWVEAVQSSPSGDALQSGVGYIDFHIRACWDAVGDTQPQTLGTIVRLYEPRS